MPAIPPKELSVDFFQCLTISDKNQEPMLFEEMLEKVFEIPHEDRFEEIGGFPIRLTRLQKKNGLYIGEVVKHRIYDPAIKGSLEGVSEAIVIKEGESLLALNAFLYSPADGCLCLERNRLAVGSTTFSKYLSLKAQSKTSIELRVILNGDALKKLGDMAKIKKFSFRIASFGNFANAIDKRPAVGRALSIAEDLSAPYVTIEAGMSHQKGALNRKSVMSWVNDLMALIGVHPESVTSAKVYGAESSEDELHPLDLLEDRILYKEEVQLSHDPDELYEARSKLVARAWREKNAEIKSILGSEK